MRHERDALVVLRRTDSKRADLAEAALEAMVGEADVTKVSRLRLCDFLWYVLPHQQQASPAHRTEVTSALGTLFHLAGLERYAAVCSSQQTASIQATYDDGDARGVDAYRAAIHESGIAAPDTDGLVWGRVQGPHEHAAALACSAMLEQAIDEGRLLVGRNGWRSQQRRLTESWLRMPQIRLAGRSWLERIHRERLDEWTEGDPAWNRLAARIAPRIARDVPIPDDRREPFPVVRWFLDLADDGAPLTTQNALRPDLVEEAAARFWPDHPSPDHSRPDHSADGSGPSPLAEARTIVQRQLRAVRRSGRSLITTPRGRRMRNDREFFWRTSALAMIGFDPDDEPDFEITARLCALMVIVADDSDRDIDDLVPIVDDLVRSRAWSAGSENRAFGQGIRAAVVALRRRMVALGTITDASGSTLALDDVGVAAALTALRAAALGPRRTSPNRHPAWIGLD